MARHTRSRSQTATVAIGDTELAVRYVYEPAEPVEYERGGNPVYPGAPEGVTIEAVYAVDARIADLRRALAALLARPNEARAIDRAAVVLHDTRDYVGPELTDDVTSALTDELAERCLEDWHNDEADAKAAHDDYAYEMARDAAREAGE